MASPSGPKWLDVYNTPYSDGSNTVANAFFCSLICASLVYCVFVSWRTRRCVPFSFVMCVAYVFEIAAYALRFQSWNYSRFSTEVGLFTIAPIFISIGIHICTADVLNILGAEHSPLSPTAHLRLFVGADLVAFLLQGIGLGLTFSGARGAGPWGLLLAAQAHPGQTILFAGLVLQSLTLALALGLLATTYASAGRADRRRYGSYATATSHDAQAPPATAVVLSRRAKTFLAVLPLACACLLARCAYRAAAAWAGLGGPVARDATAWLVAEGVLLTEAMVTLAVFHPGAWLCDGTTSSNSNSRAERTMQQRRDVEAGLSHGVAAKRLSSGTTLSMDELEEEKHRARGRPLQQQHEAEESAHGLMLGGAPNLMAPSEAGSASELGSPSRWRSSVLNMDPYYHFEDDSPYDPHPAPASPAGPASFPSSPRPLGRAPYYLSEEDEHDSSSDSDHARYVTAETRGLSPMEAEAEQARLDAAAFTSDAAPEPPRKSSKRMSRVLELRDAPVITRSQQHDADEETERAERHDRFDAESFVEPPRKSSKRLSRVLVDSSSSSSSNNVTRGATVGSSAQPPRKLSRKGTGARRDEDGFDADEDDRMEVESIVLPPRKPSKRDTLHGGADEDLDAVSLYSQ